MDAVKPSDPGTVILRPVTKIRRFATARSVSALILREMVTTYGRSPGGYLWAILEPVAGVALLVSIFALIFRSPPLGTNFAMFYATGIVPYMMYMSVSGKIGQALLFSRQLLMYPSVTFVDALAARFVLDFLTQLLISYIIFLGIVLIYETQTALNFPAIVLAFTMLGALSLGVGTLNSFLTVMFPVWARVWAIMNRPLMLISGVLFTPESVPEPYRTYMLYNPIVHIVGQMRKAFYPYYDAAYVSPTFVFLVSIVLLVFGLLFLLRYHRVLLSM
jgi:capsular polysaccharide transport system permease protein